MTCYNINATDSFLSYKNLIENAQVGDKFTFHEGNYLWNMPISITTSGITIIGEGEVNIKSSVIGTALSIGVNIGREDLVDAEKEQFKIKAYLSESTGDQNHNADHKNYVTVGGEHKVAQGSMVLVRDVNQTTVDGIEKFYRESLFMAESAHYDKSSNTTKIVLDHNANTEMVAGAYEGIEFDIPMGAGVRFFAPTKDVKI